MILPARGADRGHVDVTVALSHRLVDRSVTCLLKRADRFCPVVVMA
jgi:hypothetical protein